MKLKTIAYKQYKTQIPASGKHILGQYDDESIWVYQAYRPSIALYAVQHQQFGGDWSFNRMSWIKPNFLWMMYRCGWAAKEGQEHVLAIRLKRSGFEEILKRAVHSSFQETFYSSHEEWKKKLQHSDVRVQWDPDHDPFGHKQERKAIQLGMSGETLRQFALEWTLEINDISTFVKEQGKTVAANNLDELMVPEEKVYITETSI